MNKEKIEKHLSDHALSYMVVFLGVAVVVSLVAAGVYFATFHERPLATEPDRWGQFGDYLGGALNPVFGFLSVLALLVALVLQNRELRLSTEELRNSSEALKGQNKAIEHQRFEQTFFAWLNNYHGLLQSISYIVQPSQNEVKGTRTLMCWWGPEVAHGVPFRLVREQLDPNDEYTPYNEWFAALPNNAGARAAAAIALVEARLTPAVFQAWEAVYLGNEYQLDSLFRNLYRLILWVDSQHEDQLTAAQKWLYVGIVRAQLSWIEQVYLFYNGLTERGAKFRQLINKYALFDNLTFENDPVLEHVRNNQPPSAAYEERAFSSLMARRALGLPDTAEDTMALAAQDGRQAIERD